MSLLSYLVKSLSVVVASVVLVSPTASAQTGTPAIKPMISARDGHVLALDEQGRVFAWGGDAQGALGTGRPVYSATPTKIEGLPKLHSVSASRSHVLALSTNGDVRSWGDNTSGQLGLRENTNTGKPSLVRGLVGITQVAAGEGFSLALTTSGQVYVWGRNPITQKIESIPVLINGVSGVAKLTIGTQHILMLKRDGTLLAAGDNRNGQLGVGNRQLYSEVVRVPRLSGVKSISARGDTSIVVLEDRRLFGFGKFGFGEAEIVISSPYLVQFPFNYGATIANVHAGSGTFYVLWSDGYIRPYVFSRSNNGLIETFVFTFEQYLFDLGGSEFQVAVSNARRTDFVLYPDGKLSARGFNQEGQLGIGATTAFDSREVSTVRVPPIRQLSVTDGAVMAVSTSGDLYGWGSNTSGELADGTPVNREVPVPVELPEPVTKVAAGSRFSLALGVSGKVYAWGDNGGGQLGDGTFRRRSSPQPIADLPAVKDLAAGCFFSLFATREGRLYEAGLSVNNRNGLVKEAFRSDVQQDPIERVGAACSAGFDVRASGVIEGQGSNRNGLIYPAPETFETYYNGATYIRLPDKVVQISGGANHVVALSASGKVWTWGANDRGQLGSAASTGDPNPQFIPNLPPAKAVAAGQNHTIIQFSDDTLGAVGANEFGQLGTGSTADASTVAVTRRLSDVISVSAGVNTSFAVKRDGTTWAWGRSSNSFDREALGDGVYVDRKEPVLVLAPRASGNVDRDDWYLDLASSVANNLPEVAKRVIVPVAQSFGAQTGTSLDSAINFRQSDYGKNANTYIMGLVPRTFLEAAEAEASSNPVAKKAEILARPKPSGPISKADGDLVLVQLTPAGWQVVTSQLTALTTGVISGNGAASKILNNINLQILPGAQFCIGYGSNPSEMLANQTLQSVLEVPGTASNSGGVPCLKSGTYLSGPAKSEAGKSLVLRATVIGLAPSGTLTLQNNGSALESKAIQLASNQAVQGVDFDVTRLPAGNYQLSAAYSGDGTNRASSSAPFDHKREARPNLSIAGPAQSTAGEKVRFTAVLSGAAAQGITFAGEVIFRDDGVRIGSAAALAMAQGQMQASIDVLNLAAGAHNISVEFVGDAINAQATNSMFHTVIATGTDTTPNAFSFTERTGVELNTMVTSDAVDIKGINTATTISVSGGEYSIGCNTSFTSATGVVYDGDRVCLRHQSASIGNAQTSTTITVGSVSVTFRSVTKDLGSGLPAEGDEDNDGIPNGVELTMGLNARLKDNNVFTRADLFAMQQFRDFLGRQPDAAGTNFWADRLNRGVETRASMIEAFLRSNEFQGNVAPVVRLYFAYFRRLPDFDGLSYWVGQFKGGRTLSQISQSFASSSEFQSIYGSLDNRAFVNLVYENVLGRRPDADGLNYWIGQIGFGQITRGDLMAQFSESAEYRAQKDPDVLITMVYAGMLKRVPERSGFDFWVAEYKRTTSATALVNSFLAATEYRARFL